MTVGLGSGLLQWGQAGSYDAIDDRRVITALAGGRRGLVTAPTFVAGTGLAVNVGPWLAIVAVGDGTDAVIGAGAAATLTLNAGGASARTDVIWADIEPDDGSWHYEILTTAQTAGRSGIRLATVTVPVNANTAAGMTFAVEPASAAGTGVIVKVKQQDTSRPNATSRSNDPELQANLDPNARYTFVLQLRYRGVAAAGQGQLSWHFNAPAGASGNYTALYVGTSGSLLLQNRPLADNPVALTDGVNSYRGILLVGTVITGPTGGTFAYAWAQQTGSSTATILYAGSHLVLTKQ